VISWLVGLPGVGKSVFIRERLAARFVSIDVRQWCSDVRGTGRLDATFREAFELELPLDLPSLQHYCDLSFSLGRAGAMLRRSSLEILTSTGHTIIETTPFLMKGIVSLFHDEGLPLGEVLNVGADPAHHAAWLACRWACAPSRARRMALVYRRAANLLGTAQPDFMLNRSADRAALAQRVGEHAAREDRADAEPYRRLVTGANGSGKSLFAESALLSLGRELTYFATLAREEPWQTKKIADHAARRGAKWHLYELTDDLQRDVEALVELARTGRPLLLDGLSSWIVRAARQSNDVMGPLAEGFATAFRARGFSWAIVDCPWNQLKGHAERDVPAILRGLHDVLVWQCNATPVQLRPQGGAG
jgi:hypothetical protein